MRLNKFLLLLTVFLVPLIGAFGNFGYEQIKVLAFIALTTFSGLLWMGRGFKWSGISKLGGLFIIALLFTSFTGINSFQSILGAQPYFQGWILYAYLFLFYLVVASAKIKLEKWALVLIVSATVVSLLAIGQWVQINIFEQSLPTYAGRVVSTFGQPNFYAGFLLLTLPFFKFLLKEGSKWIVVGFLITVLAIIISESRIAYLLLAILILWWLIWELRWKKLILLISGIAFFIIFVFSIFFGAGWVEKEFKLASETVNPDLTTVGVEKRYYFWPVLWELVLARPVTGYGLENLAPTFSRYFETNKHILFEANLKVKPSLFGLKDLYLDRSHNYILDILVFSGILGLVAWIVLVLALFMKLKPKYDGRHKMVLLASLILYLIWIQFQNQSVVHLVYFWLLVGIIDKQDVYWMYSQTRTPSCSSNPN